MKKYSIITILILLLVAIVGGLVWSLNKKEAPDDTETQNIEWVTYRNEKYGFEIQHPINWTVFVEDTGANEPRINIYPKSVDTDPPFIHHSEVVNVSLFPKGVPTEGVLGMTATSTVVFTEPVVHSFDYVLENGESWATFATFKNVPSSWEEYGFVWARVPIDQHTQLCLGEDKEEFPVEQCYELGVPGLTLVDNGAIEKEVREIQKKILGSLRFIR